jgi:hypothetical protein
MTTQVEWSHIANRKADKLYMLIVGIAAASFSFWLLMYAPRGLHAFDVRASSAELTGRLQMLLSTRLTGIAAAWGLEVPKALELPALAVAMPLALCAGFLSE